MDFERKISVTIDDLPTIGHGFADNCIKFGNERKPFPFPCTDLVNTITDLKDRMQDKHVGAVHLQEYPALIFDRKEFAGRYDLAAFIYNIIFDFAITINLST